jgi:peptidyl-prolyl cis-trans isomerase SurA
MENNGSRVVPMFEEVMFRLKDGEISQPITTLFGQHIVRRDSAKVPDAIVERDQTKRVYKRLYFEEDKRVLLDSIRPVYGFEWNQPVLNRFLSSIDTTKTSHDSTWSKTIPADMLHQTIYKAPFSGFTVMQFADTLRWRSDLRGLTMNRSGLDRAINKLTDAAVIDAATMKLEDSSEEFRALVKEFHDGILLFKVDEQEVWSKLKFDTVDARAFYDTTRTRWKTDRKYVITEVYVLSDSIANEVHMRSDRGENLSDLAVQFTQREGAREKKGLVGAVTPKQNALARLAAEEGAEVGRIIGPIKNDKGWSIFRIDGIEEPREKTFEEAIPDLTSPYQDALQKRLTDQWLSKVRVRYPVVLDTKALDKVLASGKKK